MPPDTNRSPAEQWDDDVASVKGEFVAAVRPFAEWCLDRPLTIVGLAALFAAVLVVSLWNSMTTEGWLILVVVGVLWLPAMVLAMVPPTLARRRVTQALCSVLGHRWGRWRGGVRQCLRCRQWERR